MRFDHDDWQWRIADRDASREPYRPAPVQTRDDGLERTALSCPLVDADPACSDCDGEGTYEESRSGHPLDPDTRTFPCSCQTDGVGVIL